MVEIVSVRFRNGNKQYYFDPCGLQIRLGQEVIVETAQGPEFGYCVRGNTLLEESAVTTALRPVLRLATQSDKDAVLRSREREAEAFRICQERIAAHNLQMNLVSAEYSFAGNKVLFFFTAEERVDFRALVKDLAGTLHARIELRQIGVRDETKMLGGIGICGRPYCCAQFLNSFQPVSIKMAKTQSLSLNPTKISGACGRLMCCLKYEQDAYEDLVRRAPRQDSFVETPDGAGTVSAVDLLREQVQVRLESDPDSPRHYYNSEVRIIRSGKGHRPEGYVEPPREELEKLRRPVESAPPVPEASSPLAAALDAVFHGESPDVLRTDEKRPPRQHRRKPPAQTQQAKKPGRPPQKAAQPKPAQGKPAQPKPAQPKGEKGKAPQQGQKSQNQKNPPKRQNQPAAQGAPRREEGGKKPNPPHRRRPRPPHSGQSGASGGQGGSSGGAVTP